MMRDWSSGDSDLPAIVAGASPAPPAPAPSAAAPPSPAAAPATKRRQRRVRRRGPNCDLEKDLIRTAIDQWINRLFFRPM